jgi:hypothetical protein
MPFNDFMPSVGGFNPTQMSLVDIQNMKIPGLGDTPNFMQSAGGMYGNTNIPMNSPLVQNAAQDAIAKPEQGMSQGDMMKMASMALQGFNRGQQAPQAPTQQILRDQNQFRFAGFQQNPQQQMAQALRRR